MAEAGLGGDGGQVDVEAESGAERDLGEADGEADDPTSATAAGLVRTYENPPAAPWAQPAFDGALQVIEFEYEDDEGDRRDRDREGGDDD